MNRDFNLSKHTPKDACWALFCGDKLIVSEDNDGTLHPFVNAADHSGLNLTDAHYIGLSDGQKCFVALVEPGDIPPGFTLRSLRELYGQLANEHFWFAARAFHIITWLKNNKFCGCCGHGMQPSPKELAMECANCNFIAYPRISPAIIVAVIKDDKILLARSARFPGIYSVIAGYVEPGESLEECIHRELQEEVGIAVTDIQYFGNQPWPFPDSLMVAFTARYARGNITVDNQEIIDAGWFSADELPAIPPKISIARQLIDWFAR